MGQIYVGDFAKICGLLREYELYIFYHAIAFTKKNEIKKHSLNSLKNTRKYLILFFVKTLGEQLKKLFYLAKNSALEILFFYNHLDQSQYRASVNIAYLFCDWLKNFARKIEFFGAPSHMCVPEGNKIKALWILV